MSSMINPPPKPYDIIKPRALADCLKYLVMEAKRAGHDEVAFLLEVAILSLQDSLAKRIVKKVQTLLN